jgi:hypothetical protein
VICVVHDSGRDHLGQVIDLRFEVADDELWRARSTVWSARSTVWGARSTGRPSASPPLPAGVATTVRSVVGDVTGTRR